MLDKPIGQLQKDDLDALVTSRTSEDRGLDYKRDLNLARDDDRKELARDILAFANSVGGDLVFGVEEERDADGKTTGVPSAIVGVECNFDQTKQRLESILRDLIDPRVPGIMIEKVDGFERGPAIVVRVPRSWAAPHVLKFQNQTHFFSRQCRVPPVVTHPPGAPREGRLVMNAAGLMRQRGSASRA
jgi:predicted HTH transcriptional regulator